jgi:phosphotransferase family enzyme
MAAVASLPAGTSPGRLTDLLREAGVLPGGRVADVATETARDTLISRIVRLRLTYDPPAPTGPTHVFVKTERENADPRWRDFVRKEVDFYRHAAPDTPAGLLPRCYEAVAEPDGAWRLMLEDLTTTHEVLGEWPLPPPLAQVDAVLAAHARFHAQWWDHPRLGTIGSYADQDGTLDRFPERLAAELAKFSDRLGDRLSAERRRIYERLLAATPRLGARYRTHRHLTLVHGDAHLWNAMLPREAGRTDVRLIDWDAWRIDLATDDLACMLAMHCFPDWRARHERERLERYHARLVACGVRDYPLDALGQDYRFSVLGAITTPMWQANHGIPPWIWWNHLERIFRAVDDLDCLALLD